MMPQDTFQKIVIDQDICIGCTACVAVCPYQALEMNVDAKSTLLWEKCNDSFECIRVCPVSCIWKASEAPDASKRKDGFFKFSGKLTAEERKRFEDWRKKHGITGNPAQ